MAGTMQGVVLVMAKAPVPGTVKTRLADALGADEAAALYRCFLLDTLDLVREVEAARALAYAPASGRAWFAATCPDFLLLPQGKGDLGARMTAAFAALFARGFGPVVTIGADAPTVPRSYVAAALAMLSAGRADVVLGPAQDGGYYLVGLTAPRPGLFENIAWSSADVLTQSLARVADLGLRVTTLPRWWDVDTPTDLARLTLTPSAGEGSARHTRAYLAARATARKTN
jgi:rSAM/selenodomain-associated transferase 1